MTEQDNGTLHRVIVSAAGIMFTFVFLAALGAVVYGTIIGDRAWTLAGAAMLVLTAGAATYLKRKLE